MFQIKRIVSFANSTLFANKVLAFIVVLHFKKLHFQAMLYLIFILIAVFLMWRIMTLANIAFDVHLKITFLCCRHKEFRARLILHLKRRNQARRIRVSHLCQGVPQCKMFLLSSFMTYRKKAVMYYCFILIRVHDQQPHIYFVSRSSIFFIELGFIFSDLE